MTNMDFLFKKHVNFIPHLEPNITVHNSRIIYVRRTQCRLAEKHAGYTDLTPVKAHSEETVHGMAVIVFVSSTPPHGANPLNGTSVTFKTTILSLKDQKPMTYARAYVESQLAYKAFSKKPNQAPSQKRDLDVHRTVACLRDDGKPASSMPDWHQDSHRLCRRGRF